ncbi:branched-chain amino acid transport system ATP-binding protein [Acidovorax soli]|uniref:Branched-chain amino acid transport system ATP-binding protein n=1 Tax=Acidovorax soli TaxID=592050 RepID=A0A7X0UCD0_9BURK|nr:ATP-binding cassette domain-containing protein [Acidovorax soli]MBB6562889.1 branched-chain amino acid transport system ATP-binding protein [Acidovorax soli]
MLTIENLVLQRGGKPVLHGIDLAVAPGTVTALVGANGAGKSSTVMAVAGALPVQSGQVLADGLPLLRLRPEAVRAAGVAVVPEGHRVLGELSVLDNLRVAAGGLPATEVAGAIDAVLQTLPELRGKLADPGRSLSGGQKQMVCVAQALLARPRYLLIDELSLGLSPVVVKRLAEIVQEVARQGVGVLLIEQFTTLALSVSSQANVLVRGRMAWSGTSRALLAQPDILHSSYLAPTA